MDRISCSFCGRRAAQISGPTLIGDSRKRGLLWAEAWQPLVIVNPPLPRLSWMRVLVLTPGSERVEMFKRSRTKIPLFPACSRSQWLSNVLLCLGWNVVVVQ